MTPERTDPDARDVEAARNGDVAAFENLYRRHAARVQTIARRIAGRGEADDAAQDVFIRAWQQLRSFRNESQYATWLHRLAVNVCLRHVERRERRREVGDDVIAFVPARDSTLSRLDIAEALEALPASLRAVVVLHDLEGYAHDEIAALLKTTVSGSKMRLHRARSALRAMIMPDGGMRGPNV